MVRINRIEQRSRGSWHGLLILLQVWWPSHCVGEQVILHLFVHSIANHIGSIVESHVAEPVVVNVERQCTVVLAHRDFIGARLIDGEMGLDVNIVQLGQRCVEVVEHFR
uniref:Putative secreted protein n=1 Tax=Anopheles marajoara TaxID=58244 RepID=A0A2M4C922_9DIPT